MLSIKIKKLIKEAEFPKRSKSSDVGYDLLATSFNSHQQYDEYGTGLAISIPIGYMGLLFPRSSITKKDQILGNSVGVLDPGYHGEISFRFKSTNPSAFGTKYNVGDRIGQLIVLPTLEIEWQEVDNLGESERGESGWGSSGQ